MQRAGSFRPTRRRSRRPTSDAANDVPAELRIFGQEHFDAAEYVHGVCRDASTAAGLSREEARLEALRTTARDLLLRGADAETHQRACAKVRETVAEVRAARDALDASIAALDEYVAAGCPDPS